MRELFTQLTYLAASVLFILGLKSLTRPDTARRGMQFAAVGMLLAVIGTLVQHDIVRYDWIIYGMILGTVVGIPLGLAVPMTAMPQQIAISHLFGALAATLVGVVEYWLYTAEIGHAKMAALGFEILFGSLTVTGSFMAFGKLQGIIPERPLTYRGQNAVNLSLCAVTVGLFIYLIAVPGRVPAFFAMVALAALIGVFLVLPIGGADMPVVISLLNSYAGLASAATGFAIGNYVLIIAGALEGASGFILSIIMSRAMNRSFANVLFGAFGTPPEGAGAVTGTERIVRSIAPEDAAVQLAYAKRVIVVPGYGMAVAQAQHQVRELAELIERRGGEVKYAIHPVAGRMPGHMSVLLAEAQVDYGSLVDDVNDANSQLEAADVAVVIGANDIVNPAAIEDRSSPLYGMPVIEAWRARTVMVIKRSMASGFAGVDNPLFYRGNTVMLFGDARKMATQLGKEVKSLDGGGA